VAHVLRDDDDGGRIPDASAEWFMEQGDTPA